MKRFLILLLMLGITVNFAQLDRSQLPKAGPAPVVKIADAEQFVLSNGLKVFVVENKKLPKITYSLVLDVDPIVEGKNAGYVSTAGQLLRTGTKTRTKDKLDEEVDFLGANLNTSASGVSASGLSKHAEKLMEIMADVILNPVFQQEELEKIRKQTLSGLAYSKDEPDAISQRVQGTLLYGKEHPYGEFDTEETVKSITVDMCKNYHETYFRPNIGYLAIVGDINKAKAKSLVEKYFGKWEKKDVPKRTFTNPKAPVVNKINLVDKAGAVQSVVSVSYPVELMVGSDDALKARILNQILGGSATGRLFMNLREAKAYTYGAYSSLNPDKLVGSFSASTKVRTSVTDSTITEILNEMKKIRNEKVSDKELEAAKSLIAGNFIRSLESPATIANFAINSALYNLPKDYYKNYLKNLSAITVDDIQSTAKKLIKPNNANVLVVGSAADVTKNISKFSVSGKVENLDIYGEKFDPNVKKAPEGLTAEQVLEKSIQAKGGKENILKVKDRIQKMTGSAQGMNLSITMTQKAPNKMHQLIDIGGMGQIIMVFDGEKGKMNQMGQEMPIPAEQAEVMKTQTMSSEVEYAKLYSKIELVGMETINGKDAYVVSLTLPSGKKQSQYYDVESSLLVRNIVVTEQGSTQTDFSDYREVQGVKYAFKMTQGTPMGNIEMTTSSIEVNTNVPDSLFEVK